MQTVEMWLAQPIARLQGFAWTRRDNGTFQSITALETPHLMRVHLPNGSVWQHESRATIFTQEHNEVIGVKMLPMREAAEFSACVAEVKRLIMGLPVPPDAATVAKIAAWEKQIPGLEDTKGTHSARTRLPNHAAAFIAIKQTGEKNRWFVSLQYDDERGLD